MDGLLVPSGDEDHLAQALIRLIADNEMRRNFGANALVAAERYRIEPIMRRWEELFTELIADHTKQEQTRADRLASWLALAGGSGFAPAAPRPGHVTVGPDLESLERQIEDAVPGLIRSGAG